MPKLGRNLTDVKQKNRSSILQVIRECGPISRKDIAEIVKLTRASVTILTNEMIQEDLIYEVGETDEEEKRSGRKKVLIDINYDAAYILAINIESEEIAIGVTNLRGDDIVTSKIKPNSQKTPQEIIDQIVNVCKEMLSTSGISKKEILGVGTGVVGKVDKGVSFHAYGLWNEPVYLQEELERKLNLPVVVENNVRSLAIAEHLYANPEINDFFFVKYGPGVGGAIIMDDRIYEGNTNQAGEIGHYIVNLNGKLCVCGKRGCLETEISNKAVIEKLSNIFSANQTPILYKVCNGGKERISLHEVIVSLENGDLGVRNIITEISQMIVQCLVNAQQIIDIGNVVLFGGIFQSKVVQDLFNKTMESILGKDRSIQIYWSKLINRQSFIGASALGVKTFFYD
jgi:predicted NBD/HSP70 family sugar kinase